MTYLSSEKLSLTSYGSTDGGLVFEYTKPMGRFVFLVSKTVSFASRSRTVTFAPHKNPCCTYSPPPLTSSSYDVDSLIFTVVRFSSATAFVFSFSSLVSRLVFNCSETTPNVNRPSQAKPPFKPNRRVRKVAIKSVESACRLLLLLLLLFFVVVSLTCSSISFALKSSSGGVARTRRDKTESLFLVRK